MSSSLIVEYLDEVEEGHLGLTATEEVLPKLVLDRGEPALDDGVVVAVAPSAHAPGHAMRLKETLVVFAGIRTALVGVMQEPRGLLREGERVRFAFIQAEKATVPVAHLCQILNVSREWLLCLGTSAAVDPCAPGPPVARIDPCLP